jgi:hypothetical protein
MSHRPEWKTHYARRDHVGWWKSEIRKRGSLDAVYRHIIRRLKAYDRRLRAYHNDNGATATH